MTGLFVFGLGYSARAVVARMRPRLDAIWGTTRDSEKLSEINALGVTPILFDGGVHDERSPGDERPLPPCGGETERGEGRRRGLPLSPLPSPPPQGGREPVYDYILVSVPPDEAGDPVLRNFAEDLAAAKPKALVYLSTVGVYGDRGGAWVDETSECRPVSRRSRQRVEAEQAWRQFASESAVPTAIIRLAGIYGPGRGPFEKIRRGTARRIVKPGQVFNRIHVDDVATIVEAAFERRADGVFNGTDDEPAPPEDVLAYAAELLRFPPPQEVSFEEAELTPMARSFYGESKRVRNDKIKRELGIRLAHPTYREGLRAILSAEGIPSR